MPRVSWSRLDRVGQARLHFAWQALPATDREDADVLLDGLGELELEVLHGQPHQQVDLILGSAPVLGRKRVEGEPTDAEIVGRPHDVTHRFHAGPVPVGTRKAPAFGPAPVAVHDDGHVPGDPVAAEVDHRTSAPRSQTSRISSSFWAVISST
jgi:hypothetical protein